jgi:hypothetical protein
MVDFQVGKPSIEGHENARLTEVSVILRDFVLENEMTAESIPRKFPE